MPVETVTAETFDQTIVDNDKPVLVDFWAEWCGPCRALSPILDKIAEEHSEEIIIVKVNADENPELTEKYSVTSLPAMKVFVNGEVVKTIIGAKPKPALEHELAQFFQDTSGR